MERGLTWNIDTSLYSERQLEKLSAFLYNYDYSISKAIDEQLEERRTAETEEKRQKEEARKLKEALLSDINKSKQPRGRKPKWTLELIQEEAKKYTKRSDFSKGSPGAYSAAKGTGLLEELFPID